MNNNNETQSVVEVMINRCYGGFKVSPQAVERYIYLKKILGCDIPADVHHDTLARGIERTDEVMIQIVKELGDNANCPPTSKIELKSFPSKYAQHIKIGEYDGYESVYVDFQEYKLAKIKQVCFDEKEISNDNKINIIIDILSEYEGECDGSM